MVNQYEIYWINLDPTIGNEIKKSRPCLIISPNELNRGLGTVLASPLTKTVRNYPFRVGCVVNGKQGAIALDQTRCIDKSRLGKKIETLDQTTILKIKNTLHEMLVM